MDEARVPTGRPAANSDSAGTRTTPEDATAIFTAEPAASRHWNARDPGRAATGGASAGSTRSVPCSGRTAGGDDPRSSAERTGAFPDADVADVHRVLPSVCS